MTTKITIDGFRVDRLNMGQKAIDLSFNYSLDKDKMVVSSRISKKFSFTDNVVTFVMATMQEIKKVAGPLAGMDKEEEMKEKLVNTMNRLMMEVNDLGKIRDHEKYMKSFNRINCYKLMLPEIEVDMKKK
jgi:hypothetical protein